MLICRDIPEREGVRERERERAGAEGSERKEEGAGAMPEWEGVGGRRQGRG